MGLAVAARAAGAEGEPIPRQVITAAPSKARELGGAIRVESVTPEDARAWQAVRLSDALEYSPGLRLDVTCQNCNASEIRLLGLPQRYLSLLQDGLPTQSGLASTYGLDQVPVPLLERIDVVKGPGSVLSGPGAVAGTVDLVPRIARTTGGVLEASANAMQGKDRLGGPNRDLFGAFHLVGRQRKAGLTLHGLESHMDAVDVNGDGYSEVARRSLAAPGARAWWKPGDHGQVVADYLWTDERRRGGEMAGDALSRPPETTGIAEAIRSRRHGVTLAWDQEGGANWSWRLAGGFTHLDRDTYYGGTGPLGGSEDPDWDPTLPPASQAPTDANGRPVPPFNVDRVPGLGFGRSRDVQWLGDARLVWHGAEDHQWTGAVQQRHESLGDLFSSRTVSDDYRNVGLMLEDRWRPSERWEWVGGVRADLHGLLPDPVVSPRVAGKWQPTPEWTWRGSLGTGFRAPELFDEDLHISNVGGDLQVVRRDPSLREERSYSALIGPEWRPDGPWVLDANAFFTRIEGTFFNRIDAEQPEPGILRRTKVNADDAWVGGAEFTAALVPSEAFRIEASWIEQRSQFDRPQLHLGGIDGLDPSDPPILSRRFVRVPDRHGMVKAVFKHGPWEAFVGVRVTGPMLVPHVLNDLSGDGSPLLGSYPGQPRQIGNTMASSPWFAVMDASITRTWRAARGTEARLMLGCRNLADAYQRDLDVGRYRDGAYTYGPRFPRTFLVTVGLSF
jgi:outer membrane receptor for ferrienterochelin and colicins